MNDLQFDLAPMESIMPLSRRYTGQEYQVLDVVETASDCLDKIGNFYESSYVVHAEPDQTGYIELPRNCKLVRAVRLSGLGWPGYDAQPEVKTHFWQDSWYPGKGVHGRLWVADQVGSPGGAWSPADWQREHEFPGQPFRDYRRVEGGIQLSGVYQKHNYASWPSYSVTVAYDGYLSDERGFRLLTHKEALACAYYLNWARLELLVNQGVGDPNLADRAWKITDKHIGQARTGEGLSDNTISKLLRVAKSWNRSNYVDDFSASTPVQGQRSGSRSWLDG